MPFSRGINLKVNIIAQLEFELSYFKATVLDLSRFTNIILQYHFRTWLLAVQLIKNIQFIDMTFIKEIKVFLMVLEVI